MFEKPKRFGVIKGSRIFCIAKKLINEKEVYEIYYKKIKWRSNFSVVYKILKSIMQTTGATIFGATGTFILLCWGFMSSGNTSPAINKYGHIVGTSIAIATVATVKFGKMAAILTPVFWIPCVVSLVLVILYRLEKDLRESSHLTFVKKDIERMDGIDSDLRFNKLTDEQKNALLAEKENIINIFKTNQFKTWDAKTQHHFKSIQVCMDGVTHGFLGVFDDARAPIMINKNIKHIKFFKLVCDDTTSKDIIVGGVNKKMSNVFCSNCFKTFDPDSKEHDDDDDDDDDLSLIHI